MGTKTVDGKEYPPGDFLVVEDENSPSTWHLQVKRNGKPDHGLMGAALAALTVGYRGNKYEGPQKEEAVAKLKALYKSEGMDWPSPNMSTSVAFSATFAEAPTELGEMAVREGKLFELGDYPDKGFAFTEEDVEPTLAGFQPVDFNLQHMPTILQGKLGKLISVFRGPDGNSLFGRAAVPKWLHDVHGADAPLPISLEFDRQSKKITGAGLVYNPRVPDAQLVAAFSAAHPGIIPEPAPAPPDPKQTAALHALSALLNTVDFARSDSPEGQKALQRIHELAADAGASCKPSRTASMATTHEMNAIQSIHDLARAHGATCRPDSQADDGKASMSTTPHTRRRGMGNQFRDWLLGKAKEDQVEVPPEAAAALSAAFSGELTTEQEAAVKAANDEALKARDAEIARLKAEQERTARFAAQIEAERRHDKAVLFAKTAVETHRVPPALAEPLTALAERILVSDLTVTFAAGEKPSIDLLTAFVERLPDLGVFLTDQIQPESAFAAFTKTITPEAKGEQPVREDVVARALKATAEGRAALAKRDQQNGSGK